jgi:thioredoxin reductase
MDSIDTQNIVKKKKSKSDKKQEKNEEIKKLEPEPVTHELEKVKPEKLEPEKLEPEKLEPEKLEPEIKNYDNIVVGAGPAGLQLSYYFEKYKINYIVLERADKCASFFDKYPHSSTLISINKRFTGNDDKDFNLRHDWNSLLTDDDFLFKEYSKDFYPDSADLVRYMNDFYKRYNLNILFNTTVYNIDRIDPSNNDGYRYELTIKNDNNTLYRCKKLIIATGLPIKKYPQNIVNHDNMPLPHYGDFPKGYFKDTENLKKYENKKVLIIGNGNSAYELANILNDYCYSVVIAGRERDLSMISHYAGDIRSIYYKFFDTFYLKSMNGIELANPGHENCPYNVYNYNDNGKSRYYVSHEHVNTYINNRDIYDDVILCTGWGFDHSIFNFDLMITNNMKYPKIKYNYESINCDELYFIGSLGHSMDYKQSSGGFIHGFRYLIKLFMQINYKIPYNIIKFSINNDTYKKLTDHIYQRINNTSSLYQMYGIMIDAFYLDSSMNEIVYYQDITLPIAMKEIKQDKFNILMLTYGEKATMIENINKFDKYNPSFLHPEILLFKKTSNGIIDKIMFIDDLIADYSHKYYYEKIYRSLSGII